MARSKKEQQDGSNNGNAEGLPATPTPTSMPKAKAKATRGRRKPIIASDAPGVASEASNDHPAAVRAARRFATEKRRTDVARLYLKKTPQWKIAQIVRASQQTICDDLKIIRRLWRESQIRDFDERVSLELANIDEVERNAWKGWRKSFGVHEKTHARQKTDDKGVTAETGINKEEMSGNPAFLKIILDCIQRRCELLGLDKQNKGRTDILYSVVVSGFDPELTLGKRLVEQGVKVVDGEASLHEEEVEAEDDDSFDDPSLDDSSDDPSSVGNHHHSRQLPGPKHQGEPGAPNGPAGGNANNG